MMRVGKIARKCLGCCKGRENLGKVWGTDCGRKVFEKSLSPHVIGYTCCVISAGDNSIRKQNSDCLVMDCAAVAALERWNGCISVVGTEMSISPKCLGIVLVRKVLPGFIFTIFHTNVCLEGKHNTTKAAFCSRLPRNSLRPQVLWGTTFCCLGWEGIRPTGTTGISFTMFTYCNACMDFA